MNQKRANSSWISRRSALSAVSTGALIIASSVVPTGAGARASQRVIQKIVPRDLRSQTTKVAVVQTTPYQKSAYVDEDLRLNQTIAAALHASEQIQELDLIVFHDQQLLSIAKGGVALLRLKEFAQRSGTYLVVGSETMGYDKDACSRPISIVVEPCGKVHEICSSTPSLLPTDIGSLAVLSGCSSTELIENLSLNGAEILVRSDVAGYTQTDMRASPDCNAAFSIVVTPVQSQVDLDVPATAIYDRDGVVMSQTGVRWDQTITADLPVGWLRASRSRKNQFLS